MLENDRMSYSFGRRNLKPPLKNHVKKVFIHIMGGEHQNRRRRHVQCANPLRTNLTNNI